MNTREPSKDLQIFIPTYGRIDKQITLQSIPCNLRPQTWLVVRPSEYDLFLKANYDCNIYVLDESVSNIKETRNEIYKKAGNKHVVLDDDLVFFRRIATGDWRLRKIETWELNLMFYAIEQLLDETPYVGVASREGFNQLPTDLRYTKGKRMTRVHAYSGKLLKDNNIAFDSEFDLMEDFEFQLRLITSGVTPLMLLNWAHNQSGSNTTGGCSSFRTLELQAYWANKLAEKYPDYVKTVEKTTKTAWGGQTRTDVQVAWEKAYKNNLK